MSRSLAPVASRPVAEARDAALAIPPSRMDVKLRPRDAEEAARLGDVSGDLLVNIWVPD
jgi:hypothetical protein